MSQRAREKRVRFAVEVDRQVDVDFARMAVREGRSKRNFHAVVLRRLTHLEKTSPDELRRLGFVSGN